MAPAVPERRPWREARSALLLLASGFAGVSVLPAQTVSGMLSTKHNLAVTGPGPIQALTETSVCILSQTPHNDAPESPLWNRETTR